MAIFSTTRRRVLAFGVGGAAVLAAGSALRCVTSGYALGTADLPVALSIKQLVVVTAIVEALCPADGELPSGLSLGVPRSIDEEVYSQSADIQADMKAAIEVLEHAPPLVGVFHRLSALPVPERAAVFQRLLQEGPDVIVQAAVALKQMAGLYTYGAEGSWAAIHYDGPWQKVAVPPPSHARYEAAVAAARGSKA